MRLFFTFFTPSHPVTLYSSLQKPSHPVTLYLSLQKPSHSVTLYPSLQKQPFITAHFHSSLHVKTCPVMPVICFISHNRSLTLLFFSYVQASLFRAFRSFSDSKHIITRSSSGSFHM